MANIIGQRIPIPQIAAPQAAQAQLLSVPADAPSPVGSLGGLFKSMAAPFMDTASADYKRAETLQALARTGQINQGVAGTQAYSGFVGRGDPTSDAALAALVLGGIDPSRAGTLGRIHTLSDPNVPVDSPAAIRAQAIAGDTFGGTVAGTREAEANRILINKLVTERQAQAQERAAQYQAASQERIAGFEPVVGVDANGNMTWTTKAAIGGGTVPAGVTPAQSKDQIEALLIKQATGLGPSAAPAAPPLTTAAPAVLGATLDVNAPLPASVAPAAPAPRRDLSQLPYPIQKMMGIATEAIPYIETEKHIAGQSFDGGRTVVLEDGRTVPTTSGKWNRVDPTIATSEIRTESQRQQLAGGSEYANQDPSLGQVAQAAYHATGLLPAGRSHANALLGAIGTGEIDPVTEEARRVLVNFKQRAGSLLSSSENRSVKEQGWIRDQFDSGKAFANAESAANAIRTTFDMLKQDNQFYRQKILNLPPGKLSDEYQQKLADTEQLMRMITTKSDVLAPPTPRTPKGAPTPAPTVPAPPAVAGAQAATPSMTPEEALGHARAAIAAGADPAAVAKRLKDLGGDPSQLGTGPATTGGTF